MSRSLTSVRSRFRLEPSVPVHSNVKNEYLVFALGKETAVQAVVGSIVWAFRGLKSQEVGR